MKAHQTDKIDISQDKIIPILNRFLQRTIFKDTGIKINSDGICAGLSVLYLINKARGTEKAYFDTLRKIATLDIDNFKGNESWIAQFTRDARYAFYPKDFKSEVNQGDIDKIYKGCEEGATKTFHCGLCLDLSKAVEFFKSTVLNSQMVYLGANKHALSAYKKGDKYFLYDSNCRTGEKCFDNLTDFTKAVLIAFQVSKTDVSLNIKLKSFTYLPINPLLTKTSPLTFPTADGLVNFIGNDPDYHKSLVAAAYEDDVEMIKELFKKVPAPDPFLKKDEEAGTPFDILCMYGQEQSVKTILDRHKPSEKNFLTGLKLALMEGNDKTTMELLNNFRIGDAYLELYFKFACSGGNIKIVEKLYNDYPSLKNSLSKEAMEVAAKANNSKVLDFLIENYHTVVDFKPALIFAITNNNHTNFKKIITHPKLKIALDNELFQTACTSKNTLIVKELLERGCQVTPDCIDLAVSTLDLSFIKVVFSNPINFDPLHSMLLKAFSNILDLKTRPTPIELISNKEIGSAAVWLMTKKPQVAKNLWYAAVLSGNEELVVIMQDLLSYIKKPIDPNDETAQRYLAEACMDGDISRVGMLIRAGIKLNKKYDDKFCDGIYSDNTPITIALRTNNIDTALLLLSSSPNLNPEELKEIIKLSCALGIEKILMKLLTLDPSLLNRAIDNTMTIFDLVVKSAKGNLFRKLIEMKDLDLTLCNNGGKDSILKICDKGNLELINLLLQHQGVAVRTIVTVPDVTKAVLDAIKKNNEKPLPGLMSIHKLSQSDLNKGLSDACAVGNYKIVTILLSNNAKFMDEKDKTKIVEQLIKQKNHQDLSEFLSKYEVNGLSQVLEDIYKNVDPYIVDILIKNCADFCKSDYKTVLGEIYNLDPSERTDENILTKANFFGHEAIFRYVNSSALSQSTTSNSSTFFKTNMYFKFDREKTFAEACRQGNIELIDTLLRTGKVNEENLEYNLLEFACSFGNTKVIKYFLTKYSLENLTDNLKNFKEKKMYNTIVAVLENMPSEDLSQGLIDLLIDIRFELKNVFEDSLVQIEMPKDSSKTATLKLDKEEKGKDKAKTATIKLDSKQRKNNVRDNDNALGILFHLPLSQKQISNVV